MRRREKAVTDIAGLEQILWQGKVCQLAIPEIIESSDRQTQDTLNKGDSQHLGNCPEFTDGQCPHRLVGIEIGNNILPVQMQFQMGNKILGKTVNAW